MAQRRTSNRGFTRTGKLVAGAVRNASQSRGFEKSALLTHWADIVGEDTARISRPVAVKYGRKGLGATLTLLTTGPHAPVLKMQTERIRERVNATYGYAAIAYIKITQTAAHGFSEGKAVFLERDANPQTRAPEPATVQTAATLTHDVADTGLKAALTRLGANIIEKEKKGMRT